MRTMKSIHFYKLITFSNHINLLIPERYQTVNKDKYNK